MTYLHSPGAIEAGAPGVAVRAVRVVGLRAGFGHKLTITTASEMEDLGTVPLSEPGVKRMRSAAARPNATEPYLHAAQRALAARHAEQVARVVGVHLWVR